MILTVGALCAGGLPAAARDMTTAERGGMEAAVTDYTDAYVTGDAARMVSYQPERLLAQMAEERGVKTLQMRVMLIAQLAGAMSKMTVESARFDISAAREEEQIGGEPYVAIPLKQVIRVANGKRIQGVSPSVAFMNEDGDWRLLRIESPAHRNTVAQVYPALANVGFEPDVVTQLLP
jgi:hypothetical protein